jgi:hypothetical protein
VRFTRELAEDDVPRDEAAALLHTIERELYLAVDSTTFFAP